MAAAYHAQRKRMSPPAETYWGCAANYKPDLSAPLDPFVAEIGAFLRPDDVLLDVGGGAGRLSLPLASRCRAVVCVDPSPAMGEVFETAVSDAGITNARFVSGTWPEVNDVEGDVALVAHVTYFVTAIVRFIERLNEATRRRVLIGTRSVAAPNQIAPIFELVRGEEMAPVPGPQQLLAVLNQMGIDATVIDHGLSRPPVGRIPEDVVRIEIDNGTELGWIERSERDRAIALLLKHFDDLFVMTDDGYRRRSSLDAHELIITWEVAR
jgi:hypothetical protein